jgi:hypothetical protein
MKFLCIYKSSKPEGIAPSQQEMEQMGKLVEEQKKSGLLLATEGCMPSALGARVRMKEGKFVVTDGPFAESKELIAGFALIEAKSKQQAIEENKRFLKLAGDGEVELRQVFEGGDCTARQ